jgi:hypothetical protein
LAFEGSIGKSFRTKFCESQRDSGPKPRDGPRRGAFHEPSLLPQGFGLRQSSGALTARVGWTTCESLLWPWRVRWKSARGLAQSKTLARGSWPQCGSGCRVGEATLGVRFRKSINPERVAAQDRPAGRNGCNPVGVEDPRLQPTQGRRGRANPGLKDAIPPGLGEGDRGAAARPRRGAVSNRVPTVRGMTNVQ